MENKFTTLINAKEFLYGIREMCDDTDDCSRCIFNQMCTAYFIAFISDADIDEMVDSVEAYLLHKINSAK